MPLKRGRRNGEFVRLCTERGRSGPEVREGPRAGEAASVKSGEFKMRGRDNEGGRTPRTAAQSSAAAALDGAWSKAAKFVIKKVQGRPADATLNAEEENERKEGKALREMRIEKATKSQTRQSAVHTLPSILLAQSVNAGRGAETAKEGWNERTR